MTLMYMYVPQGPDSFVEVCYLLGQSGQTGQNGSSAVITAFPLAVSVEIEHHTIHHKL